MSDFRILDENARGSCNEGDIAITKAPWCEHCSYIAPYQPVFCDGGTWWCEDCFTDIEDVPADMLAEIRSVVEERTKAYARWLNGRPL